jgi:Sec-independent protein translocase protein TatA
VRVVINLGVIFNGTLVLAVAFILLGDKVLPKSLGNVSSNTRNTIHKTVTEFIAEEKEIFNRGKGEKKTAKIKTKFMKPGTYFDQAVDEAEKQTNATN